MANSGHWTQAISRTDAHVTTCRATRSGCHKRLKNGQPDCATARRLMRSEARVRGSYLLDGGTMPPG